MSFFCLINSKAKGSKIIADKWKREAIIIKNINLRFLPINNWIIANRNKPIEADCLENPKEITTIKKGNADIKTLYLPKWKYWQKENSP